MAVASNIFLALAIIAAASACGPNDKKDRPPMNFQMSPTASESDGFEGEAKGMVGNYWLNVKYTIHRLMSPPISTDNKRSGDKKGTKNEDTGHPRRFKASSPA